MARRFVLAAVAAVALTACGGGEDETYTVVYDISGSGTSRASLTYSDANGGTRQSSGVSLPHGISLRNVRRGDFLYISAQNDNASGNITVEIVVNGRSFKRAQSSGGYTIATASGSCC